MNEKIKVLFYAVGEKPISIEIDNTLEAIQQKVGGGIDVLTLVPGVIVVCNCEGKINGMHFNREINTENGWKEFIFGDFFVCGAFGENFISIGGTAERLVKRIIE